MIFYTDAQLFESRKEGYIAVVSDGRVLFFGSVGYKTVQEAEGLAIIQALRHIDFYERKDATIYTDNLSWHNAIRDRALKGNQPKHQPLRKILKFILELKDKWNITIEWKKRTHNQAGHFLAKVWRLKQEERDRYFMRFTELPDTDDPTHLVDTSTPTWEEKRAYFDKFHQELASKFGIPMGVIMFIRSCALGHNKTKEEIIIDCDNFVTKKKRAVIEMDRALEKWGHKFDRFKAINEQKTGIVNQIHEREGIAQIIKVCPDNVWDELLTKTEYDHN